MLFCHIYDGLCNDPLKCHSHGGQRPRAGKKADAAFGRICTGRQDRDFYLGSCCLFRLYLSKL